MARSKFVVGQALNRVARRFEVWLRERGYQAGSEMYPGAVLATALVDEYLDDYPERAEHRKSIEQHAEVVGWVSDCEEDDESDDVSR